MPHTVDTYPASYTKAFRLASGASTTFTLTPVPTTAIISHIQIYMTASLPVGVNIGISTTNSQVNDPLGAIGGRPWFQEAPTQLFNLNAAPFFAPANNNTPIIIPAPIGLITEPSYITMAMADDVGVLTSYIISLFYTLPLPEFHRPQQ